MAGKLPVGVVLVLVDPLADDNIGAMRLWNEAPGPVIDECSILIGHGCTPLRVSQSIAVVVRQWRGDDGGDKGVVVVD
jgi:hypothetical protein